MTYSTVSWKALLVSAVLTLPGLAFAAEPAMTQDGMLVDHKGMTLYTFDKDADGKSVCKDQCATNWPPLKAESTDTKTGDWTVITRDDQRRDTGRSQRHDALHLCQGRRWQIPVQR